jgi:hypothetical protein
MTPLSCRSYRDLSDLFFYIEPTAGNVLQRAGVTWFTWLLIALLVATFAALTGIKPKGSRPVAHTRLMGVARFVLVVILLIVAYMALRARPGG